MDGSGIRTFVQGMQWSSNQMTLVNWADLTPDFDAYLSLGEWFYVHGEDLAASRLDRSRAESCSLV